MDIQTTIWSATMYRSETYVRTTKKSAGDNGTKSPKQNAKSLEWNKNCGSKKYKKFTGGTKYAVSKSNGSTN